MNIQARLEQQALQALVMYAGDEGKIGIGGEELATEGQGAAVPNEPDILIAKVPVAPGRFPEEHSVLLCPCCVPTQRAYEDRLLELGLINRI